MHGCARAPQLSRGVRRMNRAHIVALLMVPLAQAASPSISVPFRDLIEHRAKYNGKRVSVRAYIVTSCTHCGEFWESVKAARDSRVHDSPMQNWIAIGTFAKPSLMDSWPRDRLASVNPKIPNDGFVLVAGIFRWNDTSRPVPKETDRVRWVRVGGFGWMGDDDKTITDITEYRPIGKNIPAGIN
jgi:hypothetical protein